MLVSFHHNVAADLDEGAAFYERQDPGVGDYFINSVLKDAARLASEGGIHRSVFGFHRKLCERFPFAIYYLVEAGEAKVYAILDLRSDPSWLRSELTGRS